MSGEFAAGTYAFGFCDRCGFRYQLNELKPEVVNKVPNGLLVCDPCLDPDHPQLELGRFKIRDPQTLLNPRPDLAQDESQSLFSWEPVGHTSMSMATIVGTVKITTT